MTGGGDTHQHPHAANPNGSTRAMRAAGQRRREGIAVAGMPMASDVVVRSLDGTLLRVVPAQVDQARRPEGQDVAPLPPRAAPLPEPDEPAYSFDVAYRYARVQAGMPEVTYGYGGYSTEDFARTVGVNHTTAGQWRARGSIPRDAADGVAVALGLHPVQLWPEWLTDGLAEADRFDTDRLVRNRDKQRRRLKGWDVEEPTSVDWRREMRLRRRRRNDQKRRNAPEEKAKIRRYAAAHYAANKERRLAWQREYHQKNRERELKRMAAYGKANRAKLNAQQRERYRKEAN